MLLNFKSLITYWSSRQLLISLRVISVLIITIILVSYPSIKYYTCMKNEHFYVDVVEEAYGFKILTKEEFKKRVDESEFFSHMTDIDLIARSTTDRVIISGEDYRNMYFLSYEEFTNAEKRKINNVVQEANKSLSSYKNLQLLSWRFVKVSDRTEDGLPHTIGDTIVITSSLLKQPERDLTKTLIHEKLHVYQRMNRASSQKWVSNAGYEALSPNDFMLLDKNLIKLSRSNPDLDNKTYYHKKSDLVLRQLYNSKTPQGITDSKAVGIPKSVNNTSTSTTVPLTNTVLGLPKTPYCQLEHPYEIMACLISEVLTNSTYTKENENNEIVNMTMKWMRDELKM